MSFLVRTLQCQKKFWAMKTQKTDLKSGQLDFYMIIFRIFITATLVYSFFTNLRDNFITKSLVTDESVKF